MLRLHIRRVSLAGVLIMYVIVVQPILAAFASDLCEIVEGIGLFLFFIFGY